MRQAPHAGLCNFYFAIRNFQCFSQDTVKKCVMGKQNKPKRDAQYLQEQDGLPLVLFVSLHVCELALARLPVFSLSLLPLTVDNP